MAAELVVTRRANERVGRPERKRLRINRSIPWESKRGEKIWHGQKVLVRGGIGFIGSKLVLELRTGLKQHIRDQSIEVV